jgi:hypothetical protein
VIVCDHVRSTLRLFRAEILLEHFPRRLWKSLWTMGHKTNEVFENVGLPANCTR